MCTRVFDNRRNTILTTGRNMDWAELFNNVLYTFYRGLERKGLAGDEATSRKAVTWTSQYDSVVVTVGPEVAPAAADGMNSAGLVSNVLYLAGSTFADEDQYPGRGGLSILRWVQYVLDNFATVDEVVAAFDNGPNSPVLISASVPDEGSESKPAELHMSVSDKHGNSAIIEVFKGEYLVHSSQDYRVMTNDPNFDKQLQLNEYWRWQWNKLENSHTSETLPGSTFSPDRFARADYFINNVRTPATPTLAVAQMYSIIRNASVPLGYHLGGDADNNEPNIAQTLWSTVAVHEQQQYFFGDVASPNVFWTDLQSFFSVEDGEVKPGKSMSLHLQKDGEYQHYAGCVNGDYDVAPDPFAV